MSLHSKWEARIVIPTGNWTASLTESGGGGAQTITLTAANTYYWSSPGNDTVDFAAKLKALLEAASVAAGNTNTYTVTPSLGESGTGKLTVSVSAGTFTLTSISADLKLVMGLSGDLTPTAATFTGARHVEAAWLPDCPVSTPYHLSSSGTPVVAAAVSLAEDGTYSLVTGSAHTRNEYSYAMISQAKAILAAESTTNESYATFWDDAVRGNEPWANAGRSLRFYKDTDDDATYLTYNVLNATQPDWGRAAQDYDGFWTIRLDVVEAV